MTGLAPALACLWVWAYDAVSPVDGCLLKAIRTSLERIPTVAEKLELSIPLPLLILRWLSAFFLGPEDVSYCSG